MTPAQFTGGPVPRPTDSQATPTQDLPQSTPFRAPPPSKFKGEGLAWTDTDGVEAWRPVHHKHQSEKMLQQRSDHRYTKHQALPLLNPV